MVKSGEPWINAFKVAKKNSYRGEVIIEAFIKGIEHTVETFTHRGQTYILAVTSKKRFLALREP